ncbi:MAG: DUF5107 domain-containing protein [Parabacteroides sp.]|nr:DUF5107 domain-containing protein [Parabacteroides sp.]
MERLFILLLSFIISNSLSAGKENVKHSEQISKASVKEVKLSMPTYMFSDPDPVARPENSYYPYFRFDGYSENSIPKEWNVVEMENDYIKLSIFPEIGGKIWGAIEKSTGKEFIYYNHAVKFRDIAMRGAWTSGGIEFNFGIIGHAPTTATPIDYFIRSNKDGSVSCFIGATEFLTQTTWQVEINLPKDKAYFTTRTIWTNTSSLEQPYYQWMNAGYKAAGNLEFCYPGQYQISHGGDVHAFPVDEQGRNISWYEKNNFGGDKSYHVLGKYNDFYGAYWHDDDFGSVHHAAYDEKLGMKIFLWGLSRSGNIWEHLLTDTDGQYVELQSGRMYNQPATNSTFTPYKHFSFVPGATDVWKEYWFPTKETGGISKASSIGTLHAIRKDGKLIVNFSPLQQVHTTLAVKSDEQVLFSEKLRLNVLETWKKEFSLTSKSPLIIEIGDKELVWYESPEHENINRPNKLPENFDWNGVYGLYVKGEQWMSQKHLRRAEESFLQCLEKDKYYLPALNKMASICYRTGRYEKALEYAKTALSLDAYNGEANYIYGLINYESRMADAKDGFSVASYSSAYRSAAYGMLAKCFLKEKDWKKSLHYASLALESNPRNTDAVLARLIGLRYSNLQIEAKDFGTKVMEEMPLNHSVRYEIALMSGDMDSFRGLIRCELPWETYIELALWYYSTGLCDEALQLLSFAKSNPIALYWSAYINHLMGREKEGKKLVDLAIAASPEGVFPFRLATVKALNYAQSVSNSWKTDYYAAILQWHLGDKATASALLDKHDNVSFAPYYQCRALLKNGKDELSDLLKAEKIDPTWRAGFFLINHYLRSNEIVLAMQTAKRYADWFPNNYMIGLKYAKALQLNGKFKESIALLKRTNVLPNEGAYEGRAIYRESHLYQAADQLKRKRYAQAIHSVGDAKEWIENLGVGKPYDADMDERIENYLMAVILEKQGKVAEAASYYRKVTDRGISGRKSVSNELLVAIAMKKLGNTKQANLIVDKWLANQSDSKIGQWATAIYKGNTQQAMNLLTERYTIEDTTPWEQATGDANFNLISGILHIIK